MSLIPKFFSVLVVLLLSGCVVQPSPLTEKEITTQGSKDLLRLRTLSDPIDGPISIHEAMARALAYNLDLQLEDFKTSLAEQQLSISRYDQLPEVVAGHLADGRSNFAGGSSRSLLTGRQSLESSTSSDRHTRTDDLAFSWNILDFGVSYFRAHQAADQLLLAEEQQRHVVNRILSDVRSTYWRAVAYERVLTEWLGLDARIAEVLAASEEIEAKGLSTPLDSLTQRRALLENKRELLLLYDGLIQARAELASLMNVPQGTAFELVDDRSMDIALPVMDLDAMEQAALTQRSELREVAYQKRINANEIKAAFVNILPGLNLNYGHTHSSNSLLFNSDWTDYSARVSWNLLGAFRFPATRSLSEAQIATLDAQRLALGGAIITQVHVSVARMRQANETLELANQLFKTQKSIVDQVARAVAADSQSEQALLSEEVNALLSSVRYDIAYAEIEGARADLLSSMGVHPSLDQLDTSNLQALAESIESFFNTQWDNCCS